MFPSLLIIVKQQPQEEKEEDLEKINE